MGYLRGWVITWWMRRVYVSKSSGTREGQRERERENFCQDPKFCRRESIFHLLWMPLLSFFSSLSIALTGKAPSLHHGVASTARSLHWVICERERATHVSVSPALILHESAGRMWTEIFYYLVPYEIPMHNFPVELRISIDKVHMYLHAHLSHSTHSS